LKVKREGIGFRMADLGLRKRWEKWPRIVKRSQTAVKHRQRLSSIVKNRKERSVKKGCDLGGSSVSQGWSRVVKGGQG